MPGTAAHGRRGMGAENHADHLAAIHDPATVLGMLEDYRAGLGVDRAADEADRAAGRGSAARRSCCGRAATTSRSCTATRGRSGRPGPRTCTAAGIDSGHHMAEDAPEATAGALAAFWAEVGWT